MGDVLVLFKREALCVILWWSESTSKSSSFFFTFIFKLEHVHTILTIISHQWRSLFLLACWSSSLPWFCHCEVSIRFQKAQQYKIPVRGSIQFTCTAAAAKNTESVESRGHRCKILWSRRFNVEQFCSFAWLVIIEMLHQEMLLDSVYSVNLPSVF